jgi:alkylation response protein AidB-like acyl-CoA dehydrogenase
MDLTLDREQQQLVATARQYVGRTFAVADQASAVNDDPLDRHTFSQLAEMGWVGLTIPEEFGGSGGSILDLALVLEELGRAAVPTPIIASAVAARTLIASGDAFARRELLSAIAAGQHIATLGLLTPGAGSEWSSGPVTGRRVNDGWRLAGSLTLVSYAHEADSIIVHADLDGRGDALVLLLLPQNGIDVTRQRTIGGEPRAKVVLTDVPVGLGDVLTAESDDVPQVLDQVIDRAAVLHTAHAVGASEASLGLSITWAKDRVQFGRPIASFQTVSNRLADMRLVIDAARLVTWEAAWALDNDKPYARERVAVAKHYLTDAAELITNNSHQVHGAMGYSTEYPLHVLTRTIKAFQASFGTSAVHLERVAQALGL